MSVRRLITFVLGVAVILAVAALGLVRAFDRAHTLSADRAVIESDQTIIGTAFAGSISDVSVAPGDTVTKGQELFRLQSPTLQQARETSRFNAEGVGYTMKGDDVLIFQATGNGTIGSMSYGVGSFVPANTEITTITLHDSMRVQSEVTMDAADFGRMQLGSVVEVVMPDRSRVETAVYDIAFEDGDQGSHAVVRSRGPELARAGSLLNGSPVTADIQLDDDEGLGAWTARQLGELLTPRGY